MDGPRFAQDHAMPATAPMRWLAVGLALALLLATAPAAAAVKRSKAPKIWPPKNLPGKLFVHFGEEHINDADGATLLPKVVGTSTRFRPDLVTMSGDKADDGEEEQYRLWLDVMKRYDRAGVPWFAAVGNHDRKAPPGFPGGVATVADFGPYADFFARRPYPMGDRRGYRDRLIGPRNRPERDPDGAASHYFVDAGPARWIFIDNSCWSIIQCDPLQNPSAQNQGGDEPQFDFLRRVGRKASKAGRLVFVVMHMPTQDPGDQTYREPTAVGHTMGKTAGGVLDNSLFEQAAADAGADGVFLGHIKGQFIYEGDGGVPYFIDGGAGGELYTTGPVGTDHGYWHGFRVLQVRRDGFRTDSVPIFVRRGIKITGDRRLVAGSRRTFEAFGRQPVFNDPAQVPALELRDPDPTPRLAQRGFTVPPLVLFAGPALLMLLALVARAVLRTGGARRRVLVPGFALLVAGLTGAGVSVAQQSEPTSTPVESLPNPARIWTSSNPQVLKPVASETDDPRRRARTQTADGTFAGRCPGRARLTITSGTERRSKRIRVTSERGKPIVRSISAGGSTVEMGARTSVAEVVLAQRARLAGRVLSDGAPVATLERRCTGPGKRRLVWGGRGRDGSVEPGAYVLEVRVLSDRRPVARRFPLLVR
jgi:hypothetical protein